jgi:hypothetical protein
MRSVMLMIPSTSTPLTSPTARMAANTHPKARAAR